MRDLTRLVEYLVRYRKNAFLSILCHILMAVFTVISIPLIIPFFQLLFNKNTVTARPESSWNVIEWLKYYFNIVIQEQGSQNALALVCLTIIAVFLLKNIFRYLAMFFMVAVRTHIVKDLRSSLYDQYLEFSLGHLKKFQRGDLISRIISDVQEVEWSMLRFIDAIFKSPIIIIGSIFFMLIINVRLTLFVFILMAFTILVIGTLSRTLKKQSLELQNKLGKMSAVVDETLDGGILIRIFRVKAYWKEKFQRLNESFRLTHNRVTRRQDLSSPLSEFLGITLVVILLWYGSNLVLGDAMDSEDFFAFIFAFYNVIEPSKSFANAYYNIKRGAAALERIEEQLTTGRNTQDNEGTKPFHFKNEIEIKDLGFSYGDHAVLKDLNFTINKGEKIALVGPSGSGKSTLVNILLKQLEPQSGSVKIDGIELSEIDTRSYYKKIGLVTQSPFLYNDTVLTNITMGRDLRTSETDREAALNEALDLAHATQFIKELPGQLQCRLGDRGDRLSGGEKQRLTIARALLEDPELLIFDEPTSALDPEAEKKVSRAILDALKDRTAIIIAHRLSTIKYADRILVLNKGRIVEQGDHHSLMAQNGKYADYVKIQSIV